MKVIVCAQQRPMNVSLFIRRGFLQLGHEVLVMGPSTPEVYGFSNWKEYRPADIDLPNEAVDVGHVIDLARQSGFNPDLVTMVDQFDFIHLTGQAPPDVKFAWLAVENWNGLQYERSLVRKADAEFYMISHDDNGRTTPPPLAHDRHGRPAEWMVFGADPEIHPLLGLERDKWTCQIGSPYEPRPSLWNALRARFDQAPYMADYNALHKSPHTIFGKVYSYAGMAEAYNRSLTALSCSNVSFVPMRASEAFAMGCVLLSDDVADMRKAFGAPYPEDPVGIWMAHDRSHEDVARKIETVRDMPFEERNNLTNRAYNTVMNRFLYRHLAERMIEKVFAGMS